MSSPQSFFDEAEETFRQLANSHRLQIMFSLHKQEEKMSGLSKILNISIQDAKRNLDNLLNEELIERDSTGSFSLTTFGSMIVRQIPSMDFLSRNKAYFSDHNFGEIPDKFIHRIGELNESKFVKGYVAGIEKIKDMYREAEEYIYGMLPEVSLELVEAIVDKIKAKRIRFSYILPEKAIVPKVSHELVKDSNYIQLSHQGFINGRMIKRIGAAVVVTDKQGAVMFAHDNGDTDLRTMFIGEGIKSNNDLFHEWCVDFFKHNWDNSEYYNKGKLIEV
ncbi:MAG TPA: transcriptional regulator [Nitrososphaeraceae archaeon]